MRLTRRGYAVLGGALCCYLFGEFAGYPLPRVLAGIAVAAVLVAVVTTLFRPEVEIERTVDPDRVTRGDPALASLTVRNPTAHRLGGFAAADRAGPSTHRLRLRPLAPGAEATYHYELPTSVRGRVEIGPLVVHRLDPFDLARSDLSAGATANLWVYPRRHQVRPPRVDHPRHHHDGPITEPPLRGSADLRSVREYVIGDEIRYLHWKATARTGQLMVREYADPAQLRCTVLLDSRPSAMSPAVFEEAVETAASLLYAAAAAGQNCRLITPAGLDTPLDNGLRAARLLLDELCLVGQNAADNSPLVPRNLATQRPGGAVLVLTGRSVESGQARRWRPDVVFRLGVDPGTRGGGAGLILAVDAGDAARQWNAMRTGGAA